MKTSVKILSLLAVAAMALNGCSKSEEVNEKIKDTFTHTVTIKAGNPSTKTAIGTESATSVSYIWSNDDADRFHVFENETAGTGINLNIAPGNETMTLAATFETAPADSYTYSAFLSKNVTKDGTKPKIPTLQHDIENGTTFDPDADVLVAQPQTFSSVQDALTMNFYRPVVVNKMTLKGLEAGEKMSSVEISADKDIAGYYNTDETWGGQAKVITVNTSQTVASDGTLTVYFISMPQNEVTLTITATSENYIFSKTFTKTINFVEGTVTKFGVNNLTATPKSDLSGYYLIGSFVGGKWQLMSSELGVGQNQNTYYNRFVSDVEKKIGSVDFSDFESISNIDNYIWQVEAYDGKYSIKSSSTNKYVSYSGDANAAQAASELSVATKFEISISESKAEVKSCNVEGRALKYNSGSPRFAFYTSGQTDIFLIPATVDTRADVTLSFATPSYDLTVGGSEYNSFSGQIVSANPAVSGITYTMTGSSLGIINSTTGAISLNGSTGTATITATFAGNDTYKPATASYTIKVTDASATTKEYTFTILVSDFNADSYADNNNEKTSKAKAVDNSEIEVVWTSYQVMAQSGSMQWQKSKGQIYNNTDLGTIKSVTVNSTAGSFTTYYGESEVPTSSTTVGNGYFNVKVGSATGKTTSIVVVFEK